MNAKTVSQQRPSTMKTSRHPFYEDVLAYASSALMVSLGVEFLRSVGLIGGGIAGLALLLEQLTPLSFGMLFTALNVPFFILALKELGLRFTVNTVVCVASVSVLSEFLHHWMVLEELNRLYAGIAGGVLVGFGMLIVFRHQASLGGVGILAYYVQQRFGWRAGYVQMGLDVSIVSVAMFVMPPDALMVSILAAVVLNFILAINHRPGRYQIG